MSSKQIVLIGGYGGHDIGDESMLTTDLIQLKKIPNVQFVALSPNPNYTSKYHKVNSYWDIAHYLTGFSVSQTEIEHPNLSSSRNELQENKSKLKLLYNKFLVYFRIIHLIFNAFLLKWSNRTLLLNNEGNHLLDLLKNSDLIFNVGGGNLKNGFSDKFVIYYIANILHKPIILSGQTIGPYNKWIFKKIACLFLNRVNLITLRDVKSKEVLKKLGINKPIIKETADDAISLPFATDEEINLIFKNEKIKKTYPLIGISTNAFLKSDFAEVKNEKDYIKFLAETADLLVDELGAEIVFIPMDYNKDSDDRIDALNVLDLMINKKNAKVIVNGYNDITLKGIIGKMDAIIGFRYHSVVFATSMGIPAIGIYSGEYYKMKMSGVLRLMENERYAIELESTSPSELYRLTKEVLDRKLEIKSKLLKNTKILIKKSFFSIKLSAEILKEIQK